MDRYPPELDDNQKIKNPRKRIKTSRACDSCRAKKIRCEPGTSSSDPAVCAQCQSHSINCTWFLPIALTRFKPRHSKQPQQQQQQQQQQQPHPHPQAGNTTTTEQQAPPGQDDSLPRRQEKVDPRSSDHRIYGSTSMSYIMHSTRSFPIESLGEYDTQYFQSLQLENNGEGFIKVYDQNSSEDEDEHHHSDQSSEDLHHHHHSPEPVLSQPTLPPLNSSGTKRAPPNEPSSIHKPKIEPAEIEQLLAYYFKTLSPHSPMINQDQFEYLTRKQSVDLPSQASSNNSILGSSSHSKLLIYTLCGLAVMNHRVPSELRLRIRRTIESFYRYNEILARCDIKSILGLLAIGFSLEFEIPEAGRICWNAVGTAVRMAQSLGLHRPIESTRHSAVHQELRRRVWSCCVITDRWTSAVFGLPMAIDLSDSDNHLTLNDPEYLSHVQQDDQLYLGHFALQSLSILLGKVLKGLYTPSGILFLKDEQLVCLMNELNEWHSRLAIISDSNSLGYLCLAGVAVEFLLFRPFMRAERSTNETLKFQMVAEDFDRLISRSRIAINWVCSNSYILEGQIIGQYSFFVCCLVQYHSYIGQGGLEALDTLGQATKVAKSVQNPDCLVRKRVYDIVQALFSTAVANRQEVEKSRLVRSSQLATTVPPPPPAPAPAQTESHHMGGIHTNPVDQPLPPVKFTDKQPMWWWDVSGIYDIDSRIDVPIDAPFRWNGLSHPTGLVNWSKDLYSWNGALNNGIDNANPHHQQQQGRIEAGQIGGMSSTTSLGNPPITAHLEPWDRVMSGLPAVNIIEPTLPQPERARQLEHPLAPSCSSSPHHSIYHQDHLLNLPHGFPDHNFPLTSPSTISTSTSVDSADNIIPSQSDFHFLPPSHSLHLSHFVNQNHHHHLNNQNQTQSHLNAQSNHSRSNQNQINQNSQINHRLSIPSIDHTLNLTNRSIPSSSSSTAFLNNP
ncbi:hypothetical protein MJO29_002333 [Puccinia striiformis f. sp. tritici]|uniref:hypothetical protein n=1 Tax=Puccinia striiformis f. sp. tritici TaxID=168172 RepID=UPI0020079591|nr:hypothetical protein Pst134EA_033257 [Puccinia striiformis f. sp. tritici]KAH9471897.1 hypothetical protein Pst134EA_033257 [Puccinia striiformis f. sp. tritici]KAI7966585.1 hypothetical protein MJO29_002333 [Puccinia striiformis f. sp. tritici]